MVPEYFWYGGWWVFPVMMPIIMLIIFLIVFYLAFGRGGFRPPWWGRSDKYNTPGRDSESPIEILKKRYAKGEITKDEFEQIRKDIER
jgi:putative membrane protein